MSVSLTKGNCAGAIKPKVALMEGTSTVPGTEGGGCGPLVQLQQDYQLLPALYKSLQILPCSFQVR